MSGHGGAHRAGPALAWLTHPATVVSLVVLVVNDHWLKSAAPGPVTGKLSDLAGLVVLPPVLAALFRAPAGLALATTGLGFVVVKATGPGADAASALWSVLRGPSVIRADLTDLLALPALLLAWWAWTRARKRPLPPRVFARAVLLPVALLGVVATSAPQYPSVTGVADHEGRLVLADDLRSAWYVSDDAGRSWSPYEDDGDPLPVRTEDCVNAEPFVCYRIVPGRLAVEESANGGRTWRTSWEVSEPARRILAADQYPDVSDVERELASRALVVWPDAGGHTVLVANGRDGYARRDTDGTWHRHVGGDVRPGEVPERRTAAARFADLPAVLLACIAAGALVVLVAGFAAGARVRQRKVVVPGALVLGLGTLVGLPAAIPDNDFGGFFLAGAVVLLGLAWLLALALPAGAGVLPRRWAAHAGGLGATVTVLAALPFVAWGAGVLAPVWLAVAIASAAVAAGLGHAGRQSPPAALAAGPVHAARARA
jgi:hypothetical protein